jgi:hypothetical protein
MSGCTAVYTVHPLATGDDNVDAPELPGTWISSKDADDRFCIQKDDHGSYSLVLSDPDSKAVEIYDVDLVRLDNQLYGDMVFRKAYFNGKEYDGPAGSIDFHVISKLELSQSELRVSLLGADAIEDANKTGYAPLDYLATDGAFLLTTSTEDLRWSLLHYSDRLFADDDGEHYTKSTETGADGLPVTTCSAIPPPPPPI